MPAAKGAWKRHGRAAGGAIAALSTVVFVCSGCGLWHRRPNSLPAALRKKPAQCQSCGRMDFIRFDSETEAKRWAQLLLQVRAGLIDELERQVRFDLLTIDHKTGKPVAFAVYVADFRYRVVETGERVTEDAKGGAMTPDAALKLRVMEASGRTVTIHTT